MRTNALKQKFAEGKPLANAWLSIPSAYCAELVAHQGFDSVTVDLQHGMIGFEAAVGMLQAISSTSAVPLVRSQSMNGPEIMKLLDAGAYGVICPQVDTAALAASFVAAVRYPPQGTRSFGPARGLLYGGADYASCANQEILALAMIESRQAMKELEAILDTPGLDGVYVGPNDLSLALGGQPSSEPGGHVGEAIDEILRQARKRGLMAGIFCSNGEAANRRLAQGFHLVTPGNDANVLAAGYKARLAQSLAIPGRDAAKEG